MKPKTALEFQIVESSNNLPAITQQQHEKAYAKCFERYAVQSRKSMFCLDCGHSWKLTDVKIRKTIICGNCRRELVSTDSYRNGLKETDYYQIITASDKFQIIRMICITKSMKKNKHCSFFAHEVMQIFIDDKGKAISMAKNVMGLSQYFDQWIIDSQLSLKPNDRNRFYLKPTYVQRSMKILPILKRNGFKGNFYGIAPQIFFQEILTDSISETLLKSRQHDMLYYHIRNTRLEATGIYWNAIKICLRNRYEINDAKLWIDYIDLLHHFNRDLRNPKYICPTDLEYAHNKLMAKKLKEVWSETIEKKKKQIAKNQKHYFLAKKQFFGLVFSERDIVINVIETVKEFLEEGCIHKHCVFTNDYYKKENALILSAKVNGVHTETVQVSLDTLEILQSRGRFNKASKHNKAIISLVTKNLHHIGERMKNAS